MGRKDDEELELKTEILVYFVLKCGDAAAET
jgi:hypothetical protein